MYVRMYYIIILWLHSIFDSFLLSNVQGSKGSSNKNGISNSRHTKINIKIYKVPFLILVIQTDKSCTQYS